MKDQKNCPKENISEKNSPAEKFSKNIHYCEFFIIFKQLTNCTVHTKLQLLIIKQKYFYI